MGQPKGVTVEDVQERNRQQHRIKDIASHIAASLIDSHLRYNMDTVQAEYAISAGEAAQVVKELQAIQRKIDPYGDWR